MVLLILYVNFLNDILEVSTSYSKIYFCLVAIIKVKTQK